MGAEGCESAAVAAAPEQREMARWPDGRCAMEAVPDAQSTWPPLRMPVSVRSMLECTTVSAPDGDGTDPSLPLPGT